MVWGGGVGIDGKVEHIHRPAKPSLRGFSLGAWERRCRHQYLNIFAELSSVGGNGVGKWHQLVGLGETRGKGSTKGFEPPAPCQI